MKEMGTSGSYHDLRFIEQKKRYLLETMKMVDAIVRCNVLKHQNPTRLHIEYD